MRIQYLIIVFFGASILFGCEETINPQLQSADPIYIVDAWINNSLDTQVVKLMYTQPYFDAELPPPVSGAQVSIQDNEGNTFTFTEHPTTEGAYIWVPSGTGFGKVGNKYILLVNANGENFSAASVMGRVPVIDSITFEIDDKNRFGSDSPYVGQFWASDPVGPGDTYWIKAFKNGNLLNKPSEINLAYDAAFSKGAQFDGHTFIEPIRNSISPADEDPNNKNRLLSPYSKGDSVYVEIHSLTEASFDYLNQVKTETDRPGGFAELFSKPLANVSTNIFNQNPKGTMVQGFFNVGSVSGLGKKFE